MSDKQALASQIARTIGISDRIRSVVIEEVDSPWKERAYIKRKKNQLDVKLFLWEETPFLYGSIYRLFLYVHDVLNPQFHYDAGQAPEEEKEPLLRDRYNQVWSIHVDSRVERIGLESFFDRLTRRNLFIDVERGLPWAEGKRIFELLWSKEVMTHPEIVSYTYDLDQLRDKEGAAVEGALEVELNRCLREVYVKKLMERIPSEDFRHEANELLNFAAYHCKDMHIESSHYGISFIYQRRIFAELIPTRENVLFLTIFNPESRRHETHLVTAESDVKEIQRMIKDHYARATVHS